MLPASGMKSNRISFGLGNAPCLGLAREALCELATVQQEAMTRQLRAALQIAFVPHLYLTDLFEGCHISTNGHINQDKGASKYTWPAE